MRTGVASEEYHLVLDHAAGVAPARHWRLPSALTRAHLLPSALALLLHEFFFVDYKRNYEKAVKLFFHVLCGLSAREPEWGFQRYNTQSSTDGRFNGREPRQATPPHRPLHNFAQPSQTHVYKMVKDFKQLVKTPIRN